MRTATSRRTARAEAPLFVLALAAFLVALQFIGAMVPSTSGHVASAPAPAPVEWSTSADVTDHADEFATCGEAGQLADLGLRPAGRERHRTTAEPSFGDLRGYEAAVLSPDGITARQSTSRSSAVPSRTSLQVFRC